MSEQSFFHQPKLAFLDVVDEKEYITLESMAYVYNMLEETLDKPIKLVLLYGPPGTGKSMLLKKLYTHNSQGMKLYLKPFFTEEEFFSTLSNDLFENKTSKSFSEFYALLETSNSQTIPTVLLDETQLYPDVLFEKIRLLADSRKIKFVITLHKTTSEELLAKEHFQTRIWESHKLANASKSELALYIQKKLINNNCNEALRMFKQRDFNTIFKLTQGNLRNTNKLLYTLFDIYEWFEQYKPSQINYAKLSRKVVEMSAIKQGYIRV